MKLTAPLAVPIIVIFMLAFSAINAPPSEHWPPHVVAPEWRSEGAAQAKRAMDPYWLKADPNVVPYDPAGSYMRLSRKKSFENNDTMRLDGGGVPLIKYGGDFYYNPGTIAQYAIAQYEQKNVKQMRVGLDKLISLQDARGAFLNNFNYAHYSTIRRYRVGWTSGFTQGVALSALARAYHLTKDSRFLDAGNKALAFMKVPYPEGPFYDLRDLDQSLHSYVFINEYATAPQVYNLAGFGYAIIGLYDWWKLTGSDDARQLYERCVNTYAKIIPYYDVGTFSVYDLGYITLSRDINLMPEPPQLNIGYHALHIELMDVMHFLTGRPVFKEYADKWREDVKPDSDNDS